MHKISYSVTCGLSSQLVINTSFTVLENFFCGDQLDFKNLHKLHLPLLIYNIQHKEF